MLLETSLRSGRAVELSEWVEEAQELYELANALPGWTQEELDALPGQKSDAVRVVWRVNRRLEGERLADQIRRAIVG